MSSMDSMYKLTKQIDALTYNSRAVLNALVRSCIASGSSNGFIVRRFGAELKLDRTDIYRLYDFYQTWAAGTGTIEPYTNDPVEFSTLVSICDAKWKGELMVTKAIVTHSKIMFMVSNNKDNTSEEYWLGLIRDSAAPKLITNSAPIPLNLRTPLYDADLSTKSFSQYETYLFPSGYNKLAITGMPGDDEDHVGGGKSWFWDIDEEFNVLAPRVRFGKYTDKPRRLANYKGTLSLSSGLDNYALGDRTVALGGMSNIAYASDSGIIGGYRNLSLGKSSVIGGGLENITVGSDSFVFGHTNIAVGDSSMAGNWYTIAGDYVYNFKIEEPESSGTVVDCETIYDETTGKCISTGITDTTTNGGRNTVRISYSEVAAAGMWTINIEKGDQVVLFAQIRKEETEQGAVNTYSPVDRDGYAYEPFYCYVTNVTRDNGDFLVTLDKSIPMGESAESLWVSGGKIARYETTGKVPDYGGNMTRTESRYPGKASNAFNFNTFTPGINQTAVGQMNVGNRDAKFMVGIGSAYVGTDSFRRNGLVVAEGYSYMQTASRNACIGVSDLESMYRDIDANYLPRGAWLYHNDGDEYAGYARVSSEHDDIGMYREGTEEEDNQLTFVRSKSSYLSSTHDVTVCLEARAGTVVINSGSYVGVAHSYDVLLGEGPLFHNEGGAIAIYSENGMELRNTNENRLMSLHNSGYISATFKGLQLHGNTWGALTATDDARSFWVFHGTDGYSNIFGAPGHCVDYPNTIAQSGFFYGENDGNPGVTPNIGKINLPNRLTGSWETNQGDGMHIINSAVSSYINTSDNTGYDVACLILPGKCNITDMMTPPHPKVINSFIKGTGNGGLAPVETYLTEELAYRSDLEKALMDKEFVLNRDTIPSVLYRYTTDYMLPEEGVYACRHYPGPQIDECPFLVGESYAVAQYSGNPGERAMTYFNRVHHPLECLQTGEGAEAKVRITAPLDHPEGIILKRFGSIVTASIEVWCRSTEDEHRYTEIMGIVGIASTVGFNISNALGMREWQSLVMSGSNEGISVTCTIMNVPDEAEGIDQRLLVKISEDDTTMLQVKFNRMIDFVVRNPSGRAVIAPITLVGVLT